MRLAIAFTSLAIMAAPASAAPIIGLYNTGVDSTGTKLADNGASDSHYIVNGGPATTYTNPAYVTAPDAVFIGALPGGDYASANNSYTLTFDLTKFKAPTASLSGKFAADNYGSVFLNGNLLFALPAVTTVDNFNQLYSFSANSGFLAGLNTLRFDITDTGKPSAFVVSGLSGTAVAVPEPATWALMMIGFGAVGATMRRRKVRTTVRYA